MKVKDVMIEEVLTIDSRTLVMKAVKMMNENDIGCLIVTRRGKAIGIVTERDLLARIIAKSKNPKETKIDEIMTKPLISGHPDMDFEEATKLMFKMNIKKLPVLESEGKLAGLVTLTDVARCQPQMMRILKKLSAQTLPPKRMQKVVRYYVV